MSDAEARAQLHKIGMESPDLDTLSAGEPMIRPDVPAHIDRVRRIVRGHLRRPGRRLVVDAMSGVDDSVLVARVL